RFLKKGSQWVINPDHPYHYLANSRFLKKGSQWVINPDHPYHYLANSMVKASDHIPRKWLPAQPSWSKELTYEATA
ncbi:ferritin-like domain-containing protein, partial [Mycolicibacter hiberniae]|nr:ferritin-like domain-containing protein [Mycolicibacter hiberniae]